MRKLVRFESSHIFSWPAASVVHDLSPCALQVEHTHVMSSASIQARRGILNCRSSASRVARFTRAYPAQRQKNEASERIDDRRVLSRNRDAGAEPAVSGFLRGHAARFLPSDEIIGSSARRFRRTGRSWCGCWPRRTLRPTAAAALAALEQGAGTVADRAAGGIVWRAAVYAVQSGDGASPARERRRCGGRPHVAIFWLASEDHDFAEINHVTFPGGPRAGAADAMHQRRRQPRCPAGRIVFDDSITPLAERAAEICWALRSDGRSGCRLQAGAHLCAGLCGFLCEDFCRAGSADCRRRGRDFHRLGAPVLRAAIERADEFHAALVERSQALEAAGYHAQVTVAPQSSLLFLIDDKIGRAAGAEAHRADAPRSPTACGRRPGGGTVSFSTADLVGILDAEPERISPAALLRPVFQDFLFSTSAQVGGPAEIAYLAQSTVLFERILGRQTPPIARFSATLIEPQIAELLRKHELTLEQVFAEENAASLALRLAARLNADRDQEKTGGGRQRVRRRADGAGRVAAVAGQGSGTVGRDGGGQNALPDESPAHAGRELPTAARGHAHAPRRAIVQALYPGGVLQERVHGAAYYFARYGLDLAETLCAQAANPAQAIPRSGFKAGNSQ